MSGASGEVAAPAKSKLKELGKTARELMGAEAKAKNLRSKRNRLIYEAVRAGAKERDAAEKAGVHPAYAHRAVVTEGQPPSGWDQNKTRKGGPRKAAKAA